MAHRFADRAKYTEKVGSSFLGGVKWVKDVK